MNSKLNSNLQEESKATSLTSLFEKTKEPSTTSVFSSALAALKEDGGAKPLSSFTSTLASDLASPAPQSTLYSKELFLNNTFKSPFSSFNNANQSDGTSVGNVALGLSSLTSLISPNQTTDNTKVSTNLTSPLSLPLQALCQGNQNQTQATKVDKEKVLNEKLDALKISFTIPAIESSSTSNSSLSTSPSQSSIQAKPKAGLCLFRKQQPSIVGLQLCMPSSTLKTVNPEYKSLTETSHYKIADLVKELSAKSREVFSPMADFFLFNIPSPDDKVLSAQNRSAAFKSKS